MRAHAASEINSPVLSYDDKGRVVERLTLTPNGREENHQEGGEAQGAADGVQRAPAVQELLGEFGIFVQGGIEEAVVGGENDD